MSVGPKSQDRLGDPCDPAANRDLGALRHPDQRFLMDYWRARKPEVGLPPRSAIDPFDLKALLPRLAIIEAVNEDGRRRFRYRLAGTEIVARVGRDPTGRCFEELYQGEYLDSAWRLYDGLCENPAPHLSHRVFPIDGGGTRCLCYDRLILPLTNVGGMTADQFLLLIAVVTQTGDRPSDLTPWVHAN